MIDPVRIRVTMDGTKAKFDLLIRGEKIIDLDFLDVLNLSLNATSALRWGVPQTRPNE